MNIHGADLDYFANKYGINKDKIIDFSGNVNPLGISLSVKENIIKNLNAVAKYPDKEYIQLRMSIGIYVKLNKENIIVGNGATELISLLIKAVEGKETLVIAPTYSEYTRELYLNKKNINLFEIKEDDDFKIDVDMLIKRLSNKINLLILCNPNNPTGVALKKSDLNIIMKKALENNIYVMIDETYIEFCEDEYIKNSTKLVKEYKNLFIVRGTSKFFGIPGLRFGYGLCSNDALLKMINNMKNNWTVNNIVSECCRDMFLDENFILTTNNLIQVERTKMMTELNKIDALKVYQSNCNFILLKIKNKDITSDYILQEMIKENVLIRDVSNFDYLNKKFIRFCINTPKNNDLLLKKIKYLCMNK